MTLQRITIVSDEIRNWFKDYFTKTGKLPEFPSEEAGGSRNLLSRQGNKFAFMKNLWAQGEHVDFVCTEKGTESEFSRSSAPSSKESKKNAKEKGKEKSKGDEPVMDEGFKKGFKPDESSFLPEVKAGIDE